jgi:hypothetical protein
MRWHEPGIFMLALFLALVGGLWFWSVRALKQFPYIYPKTQNYHQYPSHCLLCRQPFEKILSSLNESQKTLGSLYRLQFLDQSLFFRGDIPGLAKGFPTAACDDTDGFLQCHIDNNHGAARARNQAPDRTSTPRKAPTQK